MKRAFVSWFIVAWWIAVMGCRNSVKTASPTPSPSPTPAAQAVTSPAPAASPAEAEASLGRRVSITPPASFTAEQLHGQATQFIVHGEKGQFLRVKADWGNESIQPVSAQLLGDISRPVKPFYEQGDCSGNFVFQLPETGSYQVGFDGPGQDSGLSFSLLASDDPMVDPGIKPEQISIDFGSLAKGTQLKLVPFGQFKGCVDDWEPSHWALNDNRVDFRIMQVPGYKKVFEPDSSMALLEATIKNRQMAQVNKLPYPNIPDVGLNLWGRQRFLDWDGWRGISWVGAFGQDWVCGFAGEDVLAYVAQAISNDGRFFVMMRVGVSNSEAGSLLDQKCLAGPKGRDFDNFFQKQMPAIFDQEVSAADPASFTPNLDQLDAVIKSLKLKR